MWGTALEDRAALSECTRSIDCCDCQAPNSKPHGLGTMEVWILRRGRIELKVSRAEGLRARSDGACPQWVFTARRKPAA
jgi:hypothetical protein